MNYFRRILICYSEEKDNGGVIAKRIANAAQVLHNPIIPSEVDIVSVEDTFVIDKMYDLAISVGGDGTLLRVAHLMAPYNTPIIGVNLGRRGFMPEIEINSIEDSFNKIKNGEFVKKSYPYLLGRTGNDEDIAVNDIFVCKTDMLKTVELGLYVDNQFVAKYICDGILVSSAFGSTAYNRALNGSIVHPDCPVFIITPIGTVDSHFQSLVVSNQSTVRIEILNTKDSEYATVGFDGTQTVFGLKNGDFIEILDNELKFTMLHLNGFEYYDNLRKKLEN